MSMNYPLVGLIVLAAILFVLWLIRRNVKDEKKFEHDFEQSELKPEEHRENRDSTE